MTAPGGDAEGPSVGSKEGEEQEEVEEEDYDIPEEVEEVIGGSGGGVVNPAGDQETSSVAYCSNKNHNFANIGHTNMNDAKRLLY